MVRHHCLRSFGHVWFTGVFQLFEQCLDNVLLLFVIYSSLFTRKLIAVRNKHQA